MNALKVAVVVLLVAAAGLGVMLGRERQGNARLAAELAQLRAELAEGKALRAENARLSNLLAQAKPAQTPEQVRELMKLRGEVGALKQTATEAVAAAAAKQDPPSVMSGISQNPEMVKMIRDQQKMALGMIYQGLAKRANLSEETSEKLNGLLADHVMTNINHLTEMLKAGKSGAEMEKVFAAEEAKTDEELKALLGENGFKEYKDYTSNLASYLTAEQFKGMMLKGDKETKEKQGKQLYELMQEETARALASAGLPKDYQTVPTLNFRNIASEDFAEKNLQLLDSIYDNVAQKAGSFLSAEELAKFAEFRKMAVNNNRLALTMNRKMMAPPNK